MADGAPVPRGRYSASQVKTFRECQRKWGWDKIDGIKSPPNKFAELGIKVHEVLEKWLRDGIAPDTSTIEGAIAHSGIQHLPSPGTARVEQESMVVTEQADYAVRVDYAHMVQPEDLALRGWDALVRDSRRALPVVGDHKTTGDTKYAKREAELRHDEQVGLYGQAVVDETGADEVGFEWIYYQTKGDHRRSKPVRLVASREEIAEIVRGLDETALEMDVARATATTALDLPPTAAACEMYGGCFYREKCSLTAAERMRSYMAQETWAEKMKRQQAEKRAAAEAAPEVVEETSPPAKAASKPRGVNPPEAAKTPAPVDTVAEAKPAKAATNGHATKPAPATESTSLRDTAAVAFMSASIARGEHVDDELGRAKLSYSRADALLKARG